MGEFLNRVKMMLGFVLVVTLPIVVSHVLRETGNLQNSGTRARMHSNAEFLTYLARLQTRVVGLAHEKGTQTAIADFVRHFAKEEQSRTLGIELSKIEKQRDEIRRFYLEHFNAEYREKNGDTLNVEPWVQRLDSASVVGQYDFIVKNAFPIEKKYELVRPNRATPYGESHARFHPSFQGLLDEQGLYDVFLVGRDGRIVYSVFKEIDFATSLVSGPWASSGLARAFEATKRLSSKEIHFEEFTSYVPSYAAQAAFLSTPIYSQGEYQGALVVQVSSERITRPDYRRDFEIAYHRSSSNLNQ